MKSKDDLLLGRKAMTKLDSVLKRRDITLSTKVHTVEAMVFPVVMYGCVVVIVQLLSCVWFFATSWTAACQASLSFTISSWTIKKVEHQITDAFKLWHWRRLLRVPWTARRSNQSILKEINPEYSLEQLKLKLKLQYFGHLMQRANSIKKTLMLGKIQGKRRTQRQRMRWLATLTQWTWIWANSGRQWRTGKAGMLQSMGLQRVGHDSATKHTYTDWKNC